MGRSSDIEAFARLLEGAPASSVPASVATLGRTVSALRAIPAPAVPAHLAGGVALMTKAGVAGTRIAATHGAGTAAAAKVTAAKASLFGIFTAHLAPVVAGTALVAVGVTGVAVGASRSLPGDPLYGLKRATEAVQTARVTGKVAVAERRLDLATTRLHEALALQQRGGSQAQLTAEFQEWISDETAALTVLTPLADTPAVRTRLAAFAAADATALAEFPAAVVAPVTAAVKAVTTLLAPVRVTPPKLGAPAIVLPSLAIPTALPAPVSSLLPAHGRRTPARLPATAVSLPALPTKLPVTKLPVMKLPVTRLPSAGPTGVAPSAAPPTALPNSLPTPVVAVPTVLPTALPSLPAVTTLLQSLLPKP